MICYVFFACRLSGVAFVAPTVNYRWPSFPEKLIKKDYRRIFINLCLMISEYAPGLLHWRVIQKLIQSTSSVLRSNVVYLNSFHDMKVLKRPTVTPKVTKVSPEFHPTCYYVFFVTITKFPDIVISL